MQSSNRALTTIAIWSLLSAQLAYSDLVSQVTSVDDGEFSFDQFDPQNGVLTTVSLELEGELILEAIFDYANLTSGSEFVVTQFADSHVAELGTLAAIGQTVGEEFFSFASLGGSSSGSGSSFTLGPTGIFGDTTTTNLSFFIGTSTVTGTIGGHHDAFAHVIQAPGLIDVTALPDAPFEGSATLTYEFVAVPEPSPLLFFLAICSGLILKNSRRRLCRAA